MKKPDSYTTPLIPGERYHIYNRGNNYQTVFCAASDYEVFLRKWQEFISPIAKTYCYHLLPNHFHTIIEVRNFPQNQILTDEQLGKTNKAGTPLWVQQSLSNFFNSYSRTFQNRYGGDGSLFHSPFKRKHIADEAYFLQLLAYIHWNAHKHGLSAGRLYDREHCSYRDILAGTNAWLESRSVIEQFGSLAAFVRFHNEAGMPYR